MKEYYQLTKLGRGRRLRKMAFEALRQYDRKLARVRLLTNHTNGIFRVDTSEGNRFVLRITDPWGCHDLNEIRSEVAWLRALSQETELDVPQPIPTKNGSFVVTIQIDGVPEPRHCVLFSWLPGVDLSRRLTAENLYELGRGTAQLHLHAEAFEPTPGFRIRTLDKVFPYSDTGFTFIEPVVLFGEAHAHLFPPARLEVYRQAMERIETTLEDLYRDLRGIRVTHNDLHEWNVKVYRGRLAILDFEDLAWGFPVQDIATTLFYLKEFEDNSELIQAYRQGYTSLLAWPEQHPGQIDCLMAARGMMLVNYLLCSKNPEDQALAPEYVARMEAFFNQWIPG